MVDLYWAKPEAKRQLKCRTCTKVQKRKRKCEEDGYEQNKSRGYKVDNYSLSYPFCPSKATWSNAIAELFTQCKQAYLVGEYPLPGRLEDQKAIFSIAYPAFVERWEERKYHRGWEMFHEIGPKYLEALIKGMQAPFTK